MIRLDEKKWIKAGIEYVDGLYSLSAVVTHNFSDWSIVANNNIQPSIWFKLLRKADYVEISYSFDGLIYQMLRLAYFPPARKVQIGMFAAAPGKESFTVTFEDFKIQSI